MLFHYAKKTLREFIGWTAWPCPRCRVVRAFGCWSQYISEELMFAEVSKRKVGDFMTCDFCCGILAVPKGTELVLSLTWQSGGPLQELVDSTSPRLGKVGTPEEPSPTQLEALLLSIKEFAPKNAGPAGGWPVVIRIGICMVVGAIVGLCAGLAVFHLGFRFGRNDAFEHAALLLIIGATLGALSGDYWASRKAVWDCASAMLRDAISRHRLDLNKLRMAAANLASNPRYLRRVLESPDQQR